MNAEYSLQKNKITDNSQKLNIICENGITNIYEDNNLLSIIISSKYRSDGISFFTPNDFSQQLGYMNHEKDYSIPPHVHNSVIRHIEWTLEALFIRSGKVRLDIYSSEKIYLKSFIVGKGDVVLLAHGGHGFKMLEPSEIIEVKQGPYSLGKDKTRFEKIADDKVIIFNEKN